MATIAGERIPFDEWPELYEFLRECLERPCLEPGCLSEADPHRDHCSQHDTDVPGHLAD